MFICDLRTIISLFVLLFICVICLVCMIIILYKELNKYYDFLSNLTGRVYRLEKKDKLNTKFFNNLVFRIHNLEDKEGVYNEKKK